MDNEETIRCGEEGATASGTKGAFSRIRGVSVVTKSQWKYGRECGEHYVASGELKPRPIPSER